MEDQRYKSIYCACKHTYVSIYVRQRCDYRRWGIKMQTHSVYIYFSHNTFIHLVHAHNGSSFIRHKNVMHFWTFPKSHHINVYKCSQWAIERGHPPWDLRNSLPFGVGAYLLAHVTVSIWNMNKFSHSLQSFCEHRFHQHESIPFRSFIARFYKSSNLAKKKKTTTMTSIHSRDIKTDKNNVWL